MRTMLNARIIATALMLSIIGSTSSAAPIHDAAQNGDNDGIRELVESGVDVDDRQIATPLFYASRTGHIETVRLLIELGADPNAVSDWGAPLHIAARRGYFEIVEVLLENGADSNLQAGEYRTTALHGAAQSGSEEIVTLLLDHGADPNIHAGGRRKAPPIHYAAEKGHDSIVALLRSRGAHPRPVQPITREELLAADLAAGKVRAIACTPCHTYTPGDPGERGPSLWNIVGREVATEPNFPYTDPMKAVGGVWDYERLNQFIADVRGTVPGTDMYTGDEPDRAIRIALIAYLRTMADDLKPLP